MVTLSIGETFEITCTAVGVPVPEIVWRKNWGHIPSKCRSISENGFGRLICENIQVEDQGAYSCEAINIKGPTFAVPDTILVIKQEKICPAGYFNNEARTQNECIKCFCFGQSVNCRSADLFIFQVRIYLFFQKKILSTLTFFSSNHLLIPSNCSVFTSILTQVSLTLEMNQYTGELSPISILLDQKDCTLPCLTIQLFRSQMSFLTSLCQ